jgi:tRNA uridine 5-carboxymethylaminomethyl modification enzyme
LTQIGRSVGIVDNIRWDRLLQKLKDMRQLEDYLKSTRKDGKSLWQCIKQPQHPLSISMAEDPDVMGLRLSGEVMNAVMIDSKYEGYMARQEKQVAAFRNLENIKLPQSLDYHAIPHLRFEAKEKLTPRRHHAGRYYRHPDPSEKDPVELINPALKAAGFILKNAITWGRSIAI